MEELLSWLDYILSYSVLLFIFIKGVKLGYFDLFDMILINNKQEGL
ncbi:MAG: hypothetical protein ACP5D2_04155 [Candidatus Nanoarchaeia archaeon]